MPRGAIVLIQTRWHEDDLAGRLLDNEAGQWDVLELPALDESGAALWPEWYDEEALGRIRNTIGQREWSALYQQRPQPDDGTFFQRDWFKEWEAKPALRYYGSSDYAVTDGGGDYTVHRVWGIDAEGAIYRVDGWRGQATSDVWIEEKLNLIAKHKPLCWFGEGGVIQKAVEPMLKRRMRERKVFCRLEWMPSVADKPTRARSFQAMAASGRVYFEAGADLGEFLSFPAGKHDDEVDTASLIGRAIDQAHPAIVADRDNNKPRDRWDKAFNKEPADSWKTL
jgi:predicted phage terminase large subunit-like protein